MQRVFGWSKRGPRRPGRAPVSLVEYLQRVDVLKDLTREEIEALFQGVLLRECRPGTVLFTPEDSSEQLFFLKEGQVSIYRLSSSGKRLLTRRVGPGAVFGEMGLLGQSLQGCFAEASESSLVCVASRRDVLRVLRQRPDVSLRMLEASGRRLQLLEERLEQAYFSPVKVRLASFLLANSEPSRGVVEGYTHEEMGDIIGALRQTVTETLSEMQAKGLVEVGHKQVRIKDRARLEQLAVAEEAGGPRSL
jgi:CRP/FNR family transcriptional regulator